METTTNGASGQLVITLTLSPRSATNLLAFIQEMEAAGHIKTNGSYDGMVIDDIHQSLLDALIASLSETAGE